MEIERTPCATGGISMSSTTLGGSVIPSILGMENPQTSASITATSFSRFARATARFVVTEDFPTPPLPEAIRRTRVFTLDSKNEAGGVPGAAPWFGSVGDC